ncbi:hypothetical protein VTH8203_03311 [Vibrio thalassae]|uniref:Outer membrane protein beta-barrel domain-containing protein n=1 Tax=Vibrio thalassae TaxID=1243014 RepID=A0A240EN24_9VIBR|nr:hypothetical protein [Vibrio thalassae]SNX49663.1 hypothetical protein VTH8203_03311 [Vibrio thalassae]
MKYIYHILIFLSTFVTSLAISAGETQVSLGLGVSDFHFNHSEASYLDDKGAGGQLQLTHYPYSHDALNGELLLGVGFGYISYGQYDAEITTQESPEAVADRYSVPGEGPLIFLSSKYQTEVWFSQLNIGLMAWSNIIKINNTAINKSGTSVVYDVEVGYRASEDVSLSIGLNTTSDHSNRATSFLWKIAYSFPN